MSKFLDETKPIVDRLRWLHFEADDFAVSDIADKAANEIERLTQQASSLATCEAWLQKQVAERDATIESLRLEHSEHKPVAWGITQGNETSHIFGLRKDAERVCAWHAETFPHIRVGVVPLYRSVTLTDAERESIRKAMIVMRIHEDDDEDVLEALLERTK
jgi:hypothetical protein